VYVCMLFVTPSPLNGLSDRKTDYTIKFVYVQGWFLGYLEVHSTYLMGFYPIPSLIAIYIGTNDNLHTDNYVICMYLGINYRKIKQICKLTYFNIVFMWNKTREKCKLV